MSRVLVIPDTHAPYHHPDTFDFLRDLKKKYKPDAVVHIGDLGDGHGWSRHNRLADAHGQADEDSLSLAFCRQLYKLFPTARACIGNHDTRLNKQAQRFGIPSRLVASIRGLYESPDGWEWAHDHVIDGVLYTHGDQVRGGPNPAIEIVKANGCSVVIGHFHANSGVKWFCTRRVRRFGLSVGCLVDPESHGMAYGANHLYRPMLGAGVVIDGIPEFVPMG